MLSAGKLADLLGVLVQVQGSILNLGVQLRKGFCIPLDGLPVIVLCGHLLVAQGQQLFGTGLCFVKACFQQLGTYAVLLQCLGKTARFGDLFLGHSTAGQCHLLEGVAVGIRLIPQPALQLCPSAVQSVLQPFVQPVDAGHENVVQPVGQFRPGLGGLFLVAKEGLEDFHPGGADRILRRINGFVEALCLLSSLKGSLCDVVICPGKLIDSFGCSDSFFLCEVINVQRHLSVLVEGLFHNGLSRPLFGKRVAERARIHQCSR